MKIFPFAHNGHASSLGETAGQAPPERRLDLDLDLLPFMVVTGEGKGALDRTRAVAREQFRILRARLLQHLRARDQHSLLITSAAPAEGKTMTAINLARSLAKVGQERICLVDADLRRPGVTRALRLPETGGLRACLRGEASWRESLWTLSDRLSILPCTPSEQAEDIVTATAVRALLEELRAQFDLIVVDGPPFPTFADSQVLVQTVDAALLVVRSGHTNYRGFCRAAEDLGPKLAAVVLNSAPRVSQGKYDYYYYYADEERREKQKARA